MDFNGSTLTPSNLQQFYSGVRRKLPPKNIVKRLIHREIFFVNSNVASSVAIHKFHQNLLPNFSAENIEKPNCFLRKFSYDGRYLLAFSADQTSVEIYEYQGPAAAAHLLQNLPPTSDDCLENSDSNSHIRKSLFNCFFRQKHVVPVTQNGEQLHRECSLFTENHRFVIVVSCSFTNEETAPYYDLYHNNESLPTGRINLEDYTFHIIDMDRGVVIDRISFKTDKIYVSYNHGIYLYKNTLSILSIQHQTIHLFHVSPEGNLINVRKIGRFCFEDDNYLIDQVEQPRRFSNRSNSVPPFREVPYNTLKHRLLVFLFKYSRFQSSIKGSNLPTKQFFYNFNIFSNLRIWKVQLIDEEHMLIKYEQEDLLTNRENAFRNWNLYVVYNYKTSEIVNVYPQFSEEFLFIYENFVDYFRHPSYYTCSLSNNLYAKISHNKLMKTCADAKGGSRMDAVRMVLAMLPMNSQSCSPSPYLDFSLFSYDEKLICIYEKPRQCAEVPIRFYDRDTGRLLYKMNMNSSLSPEPRSNNTRRLVAFIFHPSDPFVIGIIRSNSQYIVNLHFRHNSTMTDDVK